LQFSLKDACFARLKTSIPTGAQMEWGRCHWIDILARNLQKFETGQLEAYSIFGGFYKLQVRGKRIKQIF
jgi:hypothetical protein